MMGTSNSLGDAAAWFGAILAGPLVIAICSIAIAALGLAMFAGRFDLRRGAIAIIGCFIVVGASTIANGLLGRSGSGAAVADLTTVQLPPPQMPRQNDRKVDDPYAGASLAH